MAISLSAADTQFALEQAVVTEHVARSLDLHAMGPSAQSILRQLRFCAWAQRENPMGAMIKSFLSVVLAAASLTTAGAHQPTADGSLANETRFVTSNDGTKIAYAVAGSGPAVILLHGGGQNRQAWRRAGYVDRLAKEFTVITIDLRGHGESDKPTNVSAFHFQRINEDVLAVADAVKTQQFVLWGFSYGANVGRYLAARSDRVSAMVYIGINFGPAVEGRFLEAVKKMPNAPAWVTAMLSYPSVDPVEMRCPTLWLVGSNNEGAMDSVKQYRDKLPGTRVTLEVIDGLNHPQELELIDQVFPRELAFTRTHSRR